MTPDFMSRAEELYFDLRDVSTADREVELKRRGVTDPELVDAVRTLLRSTDNVGAFLAEPLFVAGLAANLPEESLEDDLTGESAGAYRLERRIAVGGMGTVYLGRRADGEFTQLVAVKLIKRGMDSDELLRRFRSERQALAGLSSPYIARLLDAGVTTRGRSYLVMEFVDGIPIDEYCAANDLILSRKLALFRRVCEAVHHAHQHSVIHRDLKPSNILVNSEGIPKLLDFGIAKVFSTESDAAPTTEGERRLTPEYASPEQIVGIALTTATDIYSLGVILYEMLCGRRPYVFTTRTASEVERVVCHDSPTLPSVAATRTRSASTLRSRFVAAAAPEPNEARRIARRLRGDLDQIVMKTLRKEPEHRYPSVERLIEDIDRYLAGLPVLARKGTFTYRVRKLVRRHALATGGIALLLMALFVGVGAVLWQARVAARERDDAYLARDESEAIAEFLQRTLQAADPAEGGPDVKVRTLVDEAAVTVATDLRERPLVQAGVRSALGRSYLALGLFEKAQTQFSAAYDTRVRLLGPDHHDVAESKMDRAELCYAVGRFDEAVALLREALADHIRLRGDRNLDTARAWNNLGAALRAAGNIPDAALAHQHALGIRLELAGHDSLSVAESLNNIAGVRAAERDLAGALSALREAAAIRERLLRPDHPLVIQSLDNMAVFLGQLGDWGAAEKLEREALERSSGAFGPDHPARARILRNLGLLYLRTFAFERAEPLLRESYQIERQRLPAGTLRVAESRAYWARTLARIGRPMEAEIELEAALETARGRIPFTGPWQAAIEDLRDLYALNGHPECAAEWPIP